MFGMIAFLIFAAPGAATTTTALPTLAWRDERSCETALFKLMQNTEWHVKGACVRLGAQAQ